jgi:hypothetical protein
VYRRVSCTHTHSFTLTLSLSLTHSLTHTRYAQYTGTLPSADRVFHIDKVTAADLFPPVDRDTHIHIDAVYDAEGNCLRLPAYERLIHLITSARGDSKQTLYVYLVDTDKGEGCFHHPRNLQKLESEELPGEPGCLRGPSHPRSYTTLRSCVFEPIVKIFFGGVESNFKPQAVQGARLAAEPRVRVAAHALEIRHPNPRPRGGPHPGRQVAAGGPVARQVSPFDPMR